MGHLFSSSCSRLNRADWGQEWAAISEQFVGMTVVAGGGRNGMDAIHTGNGLNGLLAALSSTQTEVVILMTIRPENIWTGGTVSGQRVICSVLEPSIQHVTISRYTDGSLIARRGPLASGTTLGSTAAGIVPIDVLTQLQIRIKVHDSTGEIEIRKNGGTTPVLNLTGLDTMNAGTGVISSVGIGYDGFGDNTSLFRFSDVMVTSITNTGDNLTGMCGDVAVVYHLPNGVGATTQFSRGGADSGSNFGQVDEAKANAETDYVVADTVGERDLYTAEDLKVPGATILAVKLVASARKEGAGIGDIAYSVRHSGTTYVGAQKVLSTAYDTVFTVLGQNPGTAANWTESGWNAIEIGYDKMA